MHRLLAASLLAIGMTGVVSGQQDQAPAQQPAPTFRAEVSLVRVDVSVADRRGMPIAGLGPADFEVREDGVPQKVETVQFVQIDGTRQTNTADSLEIRSPEHAAVEAARDDVRLFAIFLDDYHVNRNPEYAIRAKNVLKEFVRQLGPNDLVAIMDPLTPISALQFTRARDELTSRIEEFEGRRGVFTPPRSPAESAQLGLPNPGEVRAGVTLSALSALVSHLSGLREGRKSVLFVSEGPPVALGNNPNEQRMQDILQAANRGNVTIHVYDPQPLGFNGRGGRIQLERLQRETGGRAFFNSNGSPDQIVKVIEDASAYYLVGYAPAREFSDGKFHAIEVRVLRDDARVVSRNGYWAPTAEEMNASDRPPLEPELVEALGALAGPVTGRAVDVWIGAANAGIGRTRVSVTWEPANAADARRPVRMTVEQIDPATQMPVGEPRVLASAAAPAPAGTTSLADFELPGGAPMTLRFEATTADGTVVDQWTQQVRVPLVPRETPIGFSTPRVFRAQSAFEARALAAATNPSPSPTRRFRQSDRVFVIMDVYTSSGEGPALAAHLLNSSGEKLTDLPAPAVTDGRARVTIPVNSLAPSTYVLHIEATAGNQTAHERIAFQVAR